MSVSAQKDAEGLYHKAMEYCDNEDYSTAVIFFKDAANLGHSSSQAILGECYLWGIGVDSNATIAVDWFNKAAEQGHAEAQYNLGLCYLNGYGVEKDKNKAIFWIKKAAEKNLSEAKTMLYKISH